MLSRIHIDNPQQRLIDQAVDILRSDGVIVYPTDTVYGLGCDINSRKALERIQRIKNMDPKKPLTFLCSNEAQRVVVSHLNEVELASYPNTQIQLHLNGTYQHSNPTAKTTLYMRTVT